MGKKNSKGSTQQPKNVPGKDAQRSIARAEKRLAQALLNIEDARADMTKRETKLANLLRKHGRLPGELSPSEGGDAAAPATPAPTSAAEVFAELLGAAPEPAIARDDGAQSAAATNAAADEHE